MKLDLYHCKAVGFDIIFCNAVIGFVIHKIVCKCSRRSFRTQKVCGRSRKFLLTLFRRNRLIGFCAKRNEKCNCNCGNYNCGCCDNNFSFHNSHSSSIIDYQRKALCCNCHVPYHYKYVQFLLTLKMYNLLTQTNAQFYLCQSEMIHNQYHQQRHLHKHNRCIYNLDCKHCYCYLMS